MRFLKVILTSAVLFSAFVFLVLAPTDAGAASIKVDQTCMSDPGVDTTCGTSDDGPKGSVSYDGAGGPLVGNDIRFEFFVGDGTPLNPGVLGCVGCLLDFTTGANVSEGPVYLWAGGGSFTLTGAIPALGIFAPTTLLSGSFSAAFGTGLLNITATGTDIKKEELVEAFYGPVDPLDLPLFGFSNTEIVLSPSFDPLVCGVPLSSGGFCGFPDNADINNFKIPEPTSGFLLLLGLGSLAAFGRRRG